MQGDIGGIDVFCFTNLDDFQKECWPDVFGSIPQIGDYVESRSGKRLKIVSIVYPYLRKDELIRVRGSLFLKIELSK